MQVSDCYNTKEMNKNKNKHIIVQVIETFLKCQQKYSHSSAIYSRVERNGKHKKSQKKSNKGD